jgi:stage II sporulation protein D
MILFFRIYNNRVTRLNYFSRARPELVEGYPRALKDTLQQVQGERKQVHRLGKIGDLCFSLIALLVVCLFYSLSCEASSNNNKKQPIMVRVLLDDCDKESSVRWNFVAEKGFIIYAVDANASKDTSKGLRNARKVVPAGITIAVKNGACYCNGKKLTQSIRISSVCGYIQYNDVAYDGDFFIIIHKDSFLCVNQVELEDYITAVLKTESWPGWPLEVNKVFAIACRSYVAHKVLEARRNKKPYHVKNSNAHQTYKGRHDMPLLREAVEQTKGIVLGFGGKPILAMFDCCCGGVIPAHIADFDFNKVPYLARTYACTHCKESSLYSWQVSYEHAVFEALVKGHKQEITRLFDIHIIKKDKAGLVTEVKLRGPKVQVTVSGKKLYSMLKEVKSFHFDVQKKSGKIIFTGRGFGHHLGLCQWGARQMVRDEWGYRAILRFYYPGAHFMQLT